MAIPIFLAAAAGSALQGVAKIGAGFQSARGAKASELGAKIERDMAMLRRAQIGVQSREQLDTLLGSIDSLRSTRGVGGDSMTGQAIERRTRQDAYRSEAVATLGELNKASAADMAARGYRSASRWAVPLAVIGAAGDFANAAAYGAGAFEGSSGALNIKSRGVKV